MTGARTKRLDENESGRLSINSAILPLPACGGKHRSMGSPEKFGGRALGAQCPPDATA
jgi:hypothetical protein